MRSISGLVAADNGGGCLAEDLDIEPDRVAVDVLEVEAKHVGSAEQATAAHLPQSGDAGQHVGAPLELRIEHLGFPVERRPRTDERHLAAHDVEELRDLVEARRAK